MYDTENSTKKDQGKINSSCNKIWGDQETVASLVSHGDDNIRITGAKVANGKIYAAFHPDSEKAKKAVHFRKTPADYFSGQTDTEY
jgi:hypothetical protein